MMPFLVINIRMRLNEFSVDKHQLDKPTLSPEEIAQKHAVPLSYIMQQLRHGIQVELEHTSDKAVAQEIARDHILELPDYYSRLNKMEKG